MENGVRACVRSREKGRCVRGESPAFPTEGSRERGNNAATVTAVADPRGPVSGHRTSLYVHARAARISKW